MSRRGESLALVAALLLAGCQRCQSTDSHGDAADARATDRLGVGTPEKLELPVWSSVDSHRGYGLPSGCRFDGAVKRAPMPTGTTRFIAARSALTSLALARAAEGAARPHPVSAAALIDFSNGTLLEAPWAELESPPLLERTNAGWLGAWTSRSVTGTTRALLWRGGSSAELLAEGDQLELTDAACVGETCVVLGSLVRAAAAPGASWLSGKATAPASSFRRVDLDLGGDEPWLPLAIAASDAAGDGWAALVSNQHVGLFRVRGASAERQPLIDAPHGAYDATVAGEPLVVLPGDRIDRPCGAEEFPLVVVNASGKRHELRTPAPPESVILRPLGSGALLGWVAPVSCQFIERRVVYLTLLGADGTPLSSPMAVADATGFSLSTSGARASIWLATSKELSWLRATCEPGADAGARDADAADAANVSDATSPAPPKFRPKAR